MSRTGPTRKIVLGGSIAGALVLAAAALVVPAADAPLPLALGSDAMVVEGSAIAHPVADRSSESEAAGRSAATSESDAEPGSAGMGETPGSEERAGASESNVRILVSLDRKELWLVNQRGDTLFNAPVAIGKSGLYELNGKIYDFRTPRGTRTVLAKEEDPTWIPPDWAYYEKAVTRGLEPVHLDPDEPVELSDGTSIEVRGNQVGRVNQFGNWWPFTPGMEIIFDGKLYIPPLGSEQRRVPEALGPYRLVLGDGYLIHGTNIYNTDSIGDAVSHGCIRMRNDDIERLYTMVPIGTRVEIF